MVEGTLESRIDDTVKCGKELLRSDSKSYDKILDFVGQLISILTHCATFQDNIADNKKDLVEIAQEILDDMSCTCLPASRGTMKREISYKTITNALEVLISLNK